MRKVVYNNRIMTLKDNEDYLYTNFNGEDNKGGSLFVDSRNQSIDDENIIIHGHNMQDKSMFGTLSKLLKSDYLNNNKKDIHLNIFFILLLLLNLSFLHFFCRS